MKKLLLMLFIFGLNASDDSSFRLNNNKFNTNNKGNTALLLYLSNKFLSGVPTIDKVKQMFTPETGINATNDEGYTALMLAAEKGYTEIVEFLIFKLDANINVKEKKQGRTAIILAAMNGHKDIVKLLLHCGADFNIEEMDTTANYYIKNKKEILSSFESMKKKDEELVSNNSSQLGNEINFENEILTNFNNISPIEFSFQTAKDEPCIEYIEKNSPNNDNVQTDEEYEKLEENTAVNPLNSENPNIILYNNYTSIECFENDW